MAYQPPRGEVGEEALIRLHEEFKRHGIDFATGVPCGGQEGTIYYLIEDEEIDHVAVNREAEAVGVAAGAYLAGKTPIVYMQNSGFFDSSNELGSLLLSYEIPLLYTVTWRGCPGENTPQHQTTGAATKSLLDSFGVPYRVIGEDPIDETISDLFTAIEEEQLPAVLLVPRRWYQ